MERLRWITGALLLGLLLCAAGAAEDAPRTVQICLQEEIPGNAPYVKDGRSYRRDIAVPLLDGTPGALYKKTTQVCSWLFSVGGDRDAVLRLSLKGLEHPTTACINGMPLSADEPVTLPLDQTAELQVADARSRGVIRLLFTTLPVIEIEPAAGIRLNRETDCTLRVFDPDYRAHGAAEAYTAYTGKISRRGRTSARYSQKHPYNFSLMKDGQKWDQSLLGLRSDSDWLLDSAYNDRSRMRNRVLMDVWHDIYRLPWDRTLSGATRGVFVELVISGKYRGLFVLGEKQDRTQLGLAKVDGRWHSQFFRTTETGKDNASPAGFVSLGREMPADDDPARWYNVDLRYPTGKGLDYEAEWADFYALVRLAVKGSAEELAENITRYTDLDNLARYWLFINAADMTDNMRKNMSFARLDTQDVRFNRFIVVPWDMDASLGRYYTAKKSKTDEMMSNRLFSRLIGENTLGFRDLLYVTWQELRKDVFTVDNLMARFEAYFGKIAECGADQREQEMYPDFESWYKPGYHYKLNMKAELTYIREYLEKRLVWMDERIEALHNGTYIMPQRK